MAGRKKVTEEIMATEERMETEVQVLEGAEKMPGGDATAGGSDMDLNELLESMDREPEESGGQGDDGMPELSEEEMFGEAVTEPAGTDTGEAEEVSSMAPEVAAEDAGSEKPKRTRRKKAEDQTAEGQSEGDIPAEGGEGQAS